MTLEGVFFPNRVLEEFEFLSDAEVGRLFRCCMLYAQGSDTKDYLKGNERVLWATQRVRIEEQKKNAENRSVTARENANKRWNKNATACNGNAENATACFAPDKNANNANVNVNVNASVNDITPPVSPSRGKRFVPPTLEEVTSYCKERNNGVDPEAFIAFYSSKGWKVGNQSMKDWKSAVITWEKRRKTEGRKQTEDELEEEIRRFLNDEE